VRRQKEEVRDDIVNTCFVCNIEREDFEQLNLPFIQHIKHEHNLWDYVFFRMYLESKESVDYSGLESYCFAQIREQKISWFPIKKAIIIGALLPPPLPCASVCGLRARVTDERGGCMRREQRAATRRRRTWSACTAASTI
jgi:hypothetical protein